MWSGHLFMLPRMNIFTHTHKKAVIYYNFHFLTKKSWKITPLQRNRSILKLAIWMKHFQLCVIMQITMDIILYSYAHFSYFLYKDPSVCKYNLRSSKREEAAMWDSPKENQVSHTYTCRTTVKLLSSCLSVTRNSNKIYRDWLVPNLYKTTHCL